MDDLKGLLQPKQFYDSMAYPKIKREGSLAECTSVRLCSVPQDTEQYLNHRHVFQIYCFKVTILYINRLTEVLAYLI